MSPYLLSQCEASNRTAIEDLDFLSKTFENLRLTYRTSVSKVPENTIPGIKRFVPRIKLDLPKLKAKLISAEISKP